MNCRRAAEKFEAVEFDFLRNGLGQWLNVKAYHSPQGMAMYSRDITDSGAIQDALTTSRPSFARCSKIPSTG